MTRRFTPSQRPSPAASQPPGRWLDTAATHWRRALGACVVAALLLALPACTPPEPTPPSVLLIVVDTLRADHLGCYGYPRQTSPRLDALAAEGVLFQDVVSQSSWTLPSMISLMTGHFIFASLPTLPPAQPTLAEQFQAAHYTTAAFVGNDVVGREEGFPRGFDHFVVGAELLQGLDVRDDAVHLDSGKILVDRVLAWAEDHLEQPYFLYVHFIDPHLPYLTPEGYADFDDAFDPLGPDVQRRYRRSAMQHPELTGSMPAELAKIRRAVREYDGEVAYVDARIGDLLDGLAGIDRMQNTVVAFTADHGEVIYERLDGRPDEDTTEAAEAKLTSLYRIGHGEQLFDELIRVPLIVSGPGLLRGHKVTDTVATIDLAPTLLNLAGLSADARIEGRSLAGPLRDLRAQVPQRQVLYSFCEQMTAAINPERRLKLMRHNLGPGAPSKLAWLFDLERDPSESHDLLTDGEAHHLDAAEALGALLAERELQAQGDLFEAGYLEATRAKMRALGYIK